MATITKTIGTASRDYSTITLWEADLDDTGTYSSGDDAVGECYDDSAFSETVVINGGGTVGLNSVKLTVASGQRHDGTASTGVSISGSPGATLIEKTNYNMKVDIEWFVVTGWGNGASAKTAFRVNWTNSGSTISKCIIDPGTSAHSTESKGIDINRAGNHAVNNIILNVTGSATPNYGILNTFGGSSVVANNTIYNQGVDGIDGNSVSGDIKNNLVISSGTSDYANIGSATTATNGSGDTTGTSGLQNLTTSEFVSTTAGSEDLHLASGATSIDAGTDLATTPTGVEIDIDGRDRDANADTWDLGAHEYVSSGLSITPTGLSSDEAIGSATISTGAVSITPSGIASAEAFGTASISNVQTLTPSGIATAEAIGTAALSLGAVSVLPSGIATAEAIGTAVLSSNVVILPASIETLEALGNPSLIVGNVTVLPAGIASNEAIGAAVIGDIIVVGDIAMVQDIVSNLSRDIAGDING